jgi:hypothetical protein
MIDLNTEHVISLTEAARHLPRRRAGKRPHVSCLNRWSTGGCRGIVLESIQVGGTRCTSREALARFLEALTLASPIGPQMAVRSPTKRRRAAEQAMRDLQREGV